MIKSIEITGIPEAEEILHYELQGGFYILTSDGISLQSFLISSCNIPETYIKEKVKTVFHNSNPVDDPECTRLHGDSVIAISGAMPGLVGAMMRMGSPYAAMRESITEKGDDTSETGQPVYVKLKLFNIILQDLGGKFRSAGVILDRDRILQIIKKTELNAGTPFSFTLENNIISSSDHEILTEEKYLISAH